MGPKKRPTGEVRSRTWFVTCNNPRDEEIEFAREMCQKADYGLFVFERGTKCNTLHFHAWWRFKSQVAASSLIKQSPKCRKRDADGKMVHAFNYKKGDNNDQAVEEYLCKTEKIDADGNETVRVGELEKYGTKPAGQGKRNDIDEVRTALVEGKSIGDIHDVATSYQAILFAKSWMTYKEAPRPYGPRLVYWYWGDTGTGKSYTARQKAPDAYLTKSFKWWDGYDGHKTVILDEVRGDFCKFHEMLTLLGEMPFRVECKGGSRQALYDTIYLTSNVHPKDLWQAVEDKSQLLDRITLVTHFSGASKRSKVAINDSNDMTRKSANNTTADF
jgi:hypothetical protein